jgi:hypothetical protein
VPIDRGFENIMNDLSEIDRVAEHGQRLLQHAIADQRLFLDRERWRIPDELAGRFSHEQFALVLLGLTIKAGHSLSSIRVLARVDLGSDASIIARTMVETYAAVLELTASNWAAKFDRYRANMARQERAHLNDLRANPHARKLVDKLGVASAEAFLKGSAEFYGEERLDEMARDWFGGGVQAALRARNLASLYDSVYRAGARCSHAFDAVDFVTYSQSTGFNVLPTSRWTTATLVAAVRLFLEVLKIVSDALGFGVADRVNSLLVELQALAGISESQPEED